MRVANSMGELASLISEGPPLAETDLCTIRTLRYDTVEGRSVRKPCGTKATTRWQGRPCCAGCFDDGLDSLT